MISGEYAQMYALEKDYWWYKGLHELVDEILRQRVVLGKELEILDAGCGTGRMLQVAGKYGSATGIDASPDAVFFCAQNGLSNVCRDDLNTWMPEPERYDAIISLDVLYHSAIQDDATIIAKFHHALKGGGVCIVNLPAFPLLFRNHDLAVHTRRRYRKDPATRMFRDAGFQIRLATYRLPHLFLLILAKKMIQSLVKRKDESDLRPLPQWLNGCLYHLLRMENRAILSGVPLPFGSSLFLVAEKG